MNLNSALSSGKKNKKIKIKTFSIKVKARFFLIIIKQN